MAKNENMRTFRIGNEIQIRWPILTNGEEVSLDGRKLSLYLSDQWGNDRRVETFGTEGNVIVFTFFASEQYKTGVYSLTLFENEGVAHQTCCDYCFAFKLVEHSCDIPTDMSTNELPLDSADMVVGIHGLSAYEIAVNYGYEGSEEQWMSEFRTVLSSTQIVVESVERAEHVLQQTELLMEEVRPIAEHEQERIEHEQSRVLAETSRGDNEQLRQIHESERDRQEQARQLAEQQRNAAFGDSENSRTASFNRSEASRQESFAASELQRQQTFAGSEAQRTESFGESEAARQDAFETNEGRRESRLTEVISDVTNAESLRVQAESDREVAEGERSSSESTRRLNENTRQASETTRNSNESYRRQQETRRASAEDERVQNELLRQRAETSRLQQDDVISESESLRVAAEQRRVSSENDRVAAETLRANAEQQRAAAEQQRQHDTQAAIDGIEAQITAKHEEYQETLGQAVSDAQEDVAEAIADFNRTKIVLQTENEVVINPNVKNIWRTPISELTITFAAGNPRYDDEYMIQFTCPTDSATVLTLPSGLRWADDYELEPQPGYTYQISIVDNLAIYAEWEAATV